MIASFISQIVRNVAELPDRTSRADQPDMMLVSVDELTSILRQAFDDGPDRSDEDNSAGEALYARHCELQRAELAREGEPEPLEQTLRMLERWGPGAYPATETGQIHFARAMIDSAAAAIRAHLAAADRRPSDFSNAPAGASGSDSVRP